MTAGTAGRMTSAHASRIVGNVLAICGYAFTLALLVSGFRSGLWPFPGGDVVDFYAPAGDAVRSGAPVYFPGFLYGPPWAIAFGSLSWLGPAAIQLVILALDVIALWVIAAGDLRRLGWFLWFPLVAFELAAGQLNLLVAAALVAAQRGRTWPLAAITLAKVWPVVGLPLRDWRSFANAILVLSVVSIPWFGLWPEWIRALADTSAHPLGPVVPVPFVGRALLAVALLATRRPWCQALAASIVSPGLYWGQLVVLLAPLSLFLDRSRVRRPTTDQLSSLEVGATTVPNGDAPAADRAARPDTSAGSAGAISGA